MSDSEEVEVFPEPLLRFVETFNFKKFVEDSLIPSEEKDASELVRSSAHLLAQTRNGAYLFAWDRKNAEGMLVTHVGLFSHQMKSHKVVYIHECKVNMCNASINTQNTLLAFTTKEPAYEKNEYLYDSFVTEIQPQSRVFTLNIPSPDFRSLQFLHIEGSPPKNRLSSKVVHTSHLLVIIPQVFICLYHFKLHIIELGAVMMNQPRQETIQKNFSWYQWDPHTQWLYYGRFESTASNSSLKGSPSLLFTCENLSVVNHQLLFTVSLPLPYSESMYSSGGTFFNDPFSLTLPVRELNLQVLYRRDGFWCVCLQHGTGVSNDQQAFDGNSSSGSEGNKIDYSIFILHSGYLFYGQVPLSESYNEGLYIRFMLIGCFVVAYIPDVMLHLLNVGPRVDPCHHLTFGSEHSSFAIASDDAAMTTDAEKKEGDNSSLMDVIPCLTSATSGSLLGDYSATVIDCSTNIVYDCNLNIPGFFELFKASSDPVLKEDLLHLMIVGFRHHGMALSMIEHVCQTPMTMCDHRLFAEFIISSSFANIYFDCKKFFARQIPLTTTPTFHGKVSKNPDSGNRVLLKLRQIPNFVKQLLVQSDQRLVVASHDELLNYNPPSNQAFENLCFNAVLNQPEHTRIDMKRLSSENDQPWLVASSGGSASKQQKGNRKGGVTSSHQQPEGSSSSGGIFSKIATFGRKTGNYTSPTRSGQDPQDMLTFLTHDKDVAEKLKTESTVLREKLVYSLTKGLPLRSKNTAYNTVATYCNELEKHSCNLLLVIWQSMGFSTENHPINLSLCRSPTTKEYILYELMEAYQLAHLELGLPLPIGFQTLFICMGYLTLEKVLFLQYLRNGVFTPTRKFIELILEDCDEEDARVVFQIFCNLDFALSELAFSQWHDPTVDQLQELPHNNFIEGRSNRL